MLAFYLSSIKTVEGCGKFTKIYETYHTQMYDVAYKILRDPYAEDIVHQAFLRITDIIDEIDMSDQRRVRGLVLIITRNLAINEYNRRRKHILLPIHLLEHETAEEQSWSESDFGDLGPLIGGLPESIRQMLLLKFKYGYTHKQIAKFLAVNEAAIRKRMERTLKKLKHSLNVNGDFGHER